LNKTKTFLPTARKFNLGFFCCYTFTT